MSAEDWRDIALWLASCQAATAEYHNSTKSVSSGQRKRHRSICERARQMIEAGAFMEARRPEIGYVVRRLSGAAEER